MRAAARMLTTPRRYRLTIKQYHCMIEGGVFDSDPDAHVELLEGELYEMPPMASPHHIALTLLVSEFASFAAQRRLLVQQPIMLPNESEPEPDLTVLAPGTPLGKPTVEQVLLAIEVSDRTRRFDLRRKAPLYQRSGVLETWVVDVRDQRLVVFPREGGSVVHPRGQGTRLSPRAVPEVTLDLDALFAAARP